jgi:hypothetical protein
LIDDAETLLHHFAFAAETEQKQGGDTWDVVLGINGKGLKAKVDTGATCNIMPYVAYRALRFQPTNPTTTRVTAYGGSQLEMRGKAVFPVSFNVVVENGVQFLIGLPSIRKLGILQQALALDSTLPDDVREYQDVFQGLGKLPTRIALNKGTW